MRFLPWTHRDPKVVTVLPFRDVRDPSYVRKLEESALEREWRRRLAQNAERRRKANVDEIAVDYAEQLAPHSFAMQAE